MLGVPSSRIVTMMAYLLQERDQMGALEQIPVIIGIRPRWKRPFYSGPYLLACHRYRIGWLITLQLWWTMVTF